MKILDFDYKDNINNKIIIYGTDVMQYITTCCLNALGMQVYKYANRTGKSTRHYSNISLQELLDYVKQDKQIVVLLAVNGTVRMEAEKLEEVGIREVYSVRKLWEDVDYCKVPGASNYRANYQERNSIFFFEDTIRYPEKLYLKSIDAVVSERCSLKCEGCSNLMQYYKNPQNLDVDMLSNTIAQLIEKIDLLLELRILGGEPFMNSDFVKLVDRYADEAKVLEIGIYSNATIFPGEELLDHLKNEKVIMRFSDYGELSRKLETWVNWCEENGVRYNVLKMDLWQDCGKLERHDYTEYELIDIYGNCVCRNIPTIIGNRLYNCAYAANAANLGAMYKDETEKDFLIIGANTTREEIDHFLYDRKYLEACRYCNGRNAKRASIVPHVQTSKPLDYTQLSEQCRGLNDMVNEEHSLTDGGESCTIVVPVYNMESYIERCLHSLVNQSYNKIEIIIVDDGSTDCSFALCEKIKNDNPDRKIVLLKNEHAGVVTARNTGVEHATSEFISFVDADDYLDTDYITKMMAQIDDNDLLCSGYMELNQDKIIGDGSMDRGQGKLAMGRLDMELGVYEGERMKCLWRYIFGNPVRTVKGVIWAKIFRTDLLKQVCGMVNKDIWMGEDRLLLQLYMLRCNKVKYVKECGYYYCLRDAKPRYPWSQMFINSEAIKRIQTQAVQGHPYEEILLEGIENDYTASILLGLRNSVGARAYYYPYYGRLRGKRVILYGAGNVGKWYYKQIMNDAECVLVSWMDKNARYLRQTEMLPVEGVECLSQYKFDIIIVAVADKQLYESIRGELRICGVEDEKIVWNVTKQILMAE